MAFMKTSIAFQKPRIATDNPPIRGEKRDDLVWDGEKWISEKEWEAQSKNEVKDG
jgi:hypothetical protein|tara:strand:- start:485 stop:649 length:165 start_codon:yes stop_codon:yes gene_type:complete